MQVFVHRGQLQYFRAKARKHYPNEIQAILVGTKRGNSVEVAYFAYPQYEVSNKSEVTADVHSLQEIHDDAAAEGLTVVGSIHTHPDWPPIMSPTDYKGHVDDGDAVSGIVEVTNGKTRVVFWQHDKALRCDLKYI